MYVYWNTQCSLDIESFAWLSTHIQQIDKYDFVQVVCSMRFAAVHDSKSAIISICTIACIFAYLQGYPIIL